MENYLNIKNKIVVISGAAGFLANTLIIEFLKNGAEVYGIDNNYKMLMSQYKKIKNKYPDFSGVFDWEYLNAPPDKTDPSQWSKRMKQI